MSWASVRSQIILFLKDYKLIPENKTIEESAQTYKHKSYTLKYTGSGSTINHLGGSIAFSNVCELRIIYKNDDNNERILNADTFINLQKAIAGLAIFKGFTEERTFEDLDNKHSIGTMNFEIGIEGSC